MDHLMGKHQHNQSAFQARRAEERVDRERHERACQRQERLRKLRASTDIFERHLADEPSRGQTMSHALGEAVLPPEPKQPSREALEAHLADLRERCQQICFILENGGLGELDYQSQELRSELAIHREMAATIERQLNPAAADPGAAGRQRQFEEGLALQAAEMRARHAPVWPEVLQQRRTAMLARRSEIIDARYAEMKESLLHNINQLEASGDFRQSKLLRIQLTNLRAQLEAEDPV